MNLNRRRFCVAVGLGSVAASAVAASERPQETAGLSQLWQQYAKQFVMADGRVVDTGNQGMTHTEGLATAMLAAQATNDRKTFDRVWQFALKLRRPDGLFSWKWVNNQGIADANNATDGDLLLAWALLRAGVRWADDALLKECASLSRAIRQQLFVQAPQGAMLLPGKDGFIVRNPLGHQRLVVNPSYWVFPALRQLQAADPSSMWDKLHKDALAVLEYARYGASGLPADWLILEDPVMPWSQRPARFGYEAIRVPLYLVWDGRHTHAALRACAVHMQQPGFPAWVSLDSPEKAPYAAPAGFEAVARLARKSHFGIPWSTPSLDKDYYSSSLTLLSALAAQDAGWAPA